MVKQLKSKIPTSWLAIEPNYDKESTVNVVRCFPDKRLVVPVIGGLSETEATTFILENESNMEID